MRKYNDSKQQRATSPGRPCVFTQYSKIKERDRERLRMLAARIQAPPAAVFAFLCTQAEAASTETLRALFTECYRSGRL